MERSSRSRTARRALIPLGVAFLALTLVVGQPAIPAVANGTPIKIVLSYLPNISSFGPSNATGVAELVMGEGEVRLTATGLPALRGEQYQLWILNTATGQRMSLGAFKVSDAGVAKEEWVLREPIPERGWDLMLISVEAEGAQPSEPSSRRSIAGRFPTPATGQGRPGQLPNTGGEAAGATAVSGGSLIGMIVLGLALAGVLGFGLGRATARAGAGEGSR